MAPTAAPTQNEPLMAMSTRPRYLEGISSSMARVDRGVLASDARSGDEPAGEAPDRVHREGGEHGARQVDAEGDHEQLLPTEPVGQLPEHERAEA
jgi:hypothetical protein